jgi:hypothetical protein
MVNLHFFQFLDLQLCAQLCQKNGYNKLTKEESRAWQDSVMPVRVMRLAIDDHSPHSDLYVSQLHCIFFNQSLIPVKHLINGITLAQGAPSDMFAIEYYHIELIRMKCSMWKEGSRVMRSASISRISLSTSDSREPSASPR